MNWENESEKTGLFVFRIGSRLLGVDLRYVFRISEMLPITSVPKSPDFFSGIVCFEGEVFPVFDGRLKLGFEVFGHSSTTTLLFLKFDIEDKAVSAGLIVDEVIQVIHWSGEIGLEPGNKVSSPFLTGMVQFNNEPVLLLDVPGIFASGEVCRIDINNLIKT